MVVLDDMYHVLPTTNGLEKMAWQRSRRQWPYIRFIQIVIVIAVFWALQKASIFASHDQTWSAESFNSTLSFGKIYSIGLKGAYTRRDELSLLSYQHRLDLTHIEAIDGRTLTLKQLPYGASNLKPGELGCWRSHMNTLKQMLEDGVETALIVEDDFDFDVRIRSQLGDVRKNLIDLQSKIGRLHQPYNDSKAFPGSWDILWLGACFEDQIKLRENKNNLTFVHYQDPTVIDKNERNPIWTELESEYRSYSIEQGLNPRKWENDGRYRVLQQAQIPYCTTAYAVSRRGAARLYYALTRDIKAAVDMHMGWLSVGFEAYVTIPEIISPWKVKDGQNSFIRPEGATYDDDDEDKRSFNPSIGKSKNIQQSYSARNLLHKHIFGTNVN